MSGFDPDPSNIWSCGIVNRFFLYFIINSLSCYLLSLSTNYLVSLRILELVSLFNHLSSQYSKSWLCVAAVEIFQKVLISSDLTRKFHQRFKRRIISTCTFHAAADPIGKLLAFFNLWGIQIGFFVRIHLRAFVSVVQCNLSSLLSALCLLCFCDVSVLLRSLFAFLLNQKYSSSSFKKAPTIWTICNVFKSYGKRSSCHIGGWERIPSNTFNFLQLWNIFDARHTLAWL